MRKGGSGGKRRKKYAKNYKPARERPKTMKWKSYYSPFMRTPEGIYWYTRFMTRLIAFHRLIRNFLNVCEMMVGYLARDLRLYRVHRGARSGLRDSFGWCATGAWLHGTYPRFQMNFRLIETKFPNHPVVYACVGKKARARQLPATSERRFRTRTVITV